MKPCRLYLCCAHLLFFDHTLWLNNLIAPFLLVSCSNKRSTSIVLCTVKVKKRWQKGISQVSQPLHFINYVKYVTHETDCKECSYKVNQLKSLTHPVCIARFSYCYDTALFHIWASISPLARVNFSSTIDHFHNGGRFIYSFICMLISLTGLILE